MGWLASVEKSVLIFIQIWRWWQYVVNFSRREVAFEGVTNKMVNYTL